MGNQNTNQNNNQNTLNEAIDNITNHIKPTHEENMINERVRQQKFDDQHQPCGCEELTKQFENMVINSKRYCSSSFILPKFNDNIYDCHVLKTHLKKFTDKGFKWQYELREHDFKNGIGINSITVLLIEDIKLISFIHTVK